MRADHLRPALHPLTLGHSGLLGTHNFRAILLTAGSATLTLGRSSETLTAPVFLWSPWPEDARLVVAGGSQGSHLVLGPALLSQALRHNPNAADLGYMAERRYIVPLKLDAPIVTTLFNSFEGLVSETQDDLTMSMSVIEAHLSIVLVSLYRALKSTLGEFKMGPGQSALASRFIALVEAHLGSRWNVKLFCDQLGVTRDQLTATCLRSFGRPPGVMIRQRTLLEARRLLEQSTLSVDQVADRLGFSNSPQFNRFFSKSEGMPPGRYRRYIHEKRDAAAPSEDLYAWP